LYHNFWTCIWRCNHINPKAKYFHQFTYTCNLSLYKLNKVDIPKTIMCLNPKMHVHHWHGHCIIKTSDIFLQKQTYQIVPLRVRSTLFLEVAHFWVTCAHILSLYYHSGYRSMQVIEGSASKQRLPVGENNCSRHTARVRGEDNGWILGSTIFSKPANTLSIGEAVATLWNWDYLLWIVRYGSGQSWPKHSFSKRQRVQHYVLLSFTLPFCVTYQYIIPLGVRSKWRYLFHLPML
jgi:hypothetical protein